MQRTKLFPLVISGFLVALAAPAHAQTTTAAPAADRGLPMRESAGFVTDAETPRGLWAQVGTVYSAEKDAPAYEHNINTTLLFAYGQENWEAGAVLPFDNSSAHAGIKTNGHHDGIGDLSFWGKYLPVRTEMFTFGGGLGVSTPTGDHTFGSSNVGFEPFLTDSVAVGPVSVRSHIGYQTYTDGNSDSLEYSVAALMPVTDVVGVRTEIVGAHGFDSGNRVADAIGAIPTTLRMGDNPISILPGIDLRGIEQGWEFLLRLTAGAGITKEAPDYQFGVHLVFAQTGK